MAANCRMLMNPVQNFEIPALPLPPLEQTCREMLKWAKPLLSSEGYRISLKALRDFLEPGQEGSVLSNELDNLYSSDPEILKWMPYWENWYLSQRASLPVNNNPFYLLDPRGETLGINNTELAARAVCSVLQFKKQLEEGILEPDLWKGMPLSMEQYEDIIGITRVPGNKIDNNSRARSNWITVIANGRLFCQRVLDENGKIFSSGGLARSFNTILNICREDGPEKFPLPALTCLPRTRWAHIRRELVETSRDLARTIELVEESLFVLCLDQPRFLDDEELSRGLLFGHPGNRWFDKSLQIIILGKGRIGINFEHSMRDGTPMGRFVHFLCEEINQFSETTGHVPLAEEITPQANTYLRDAVDEARTYVKKLFTSTNLNLLDFRDFGKERIKQLGVSPDGFLQTALFLAQHRAWGQCSSVLESVMLRQYKHGRTEGIRPFNTWTGKFLNSMGNPLQNQNERAILLRSAIEAHKNRISLCMKGGGIEGILILLQTIAEGQIGNRPLERLPGIYSCPAWKVLQDIAITTSTTSGEGIESAGYGPALEDGLAVRYLQRPDHLILSVTGFQDAEEARKTFINHLWDALVDMESVLSASCDGISKGMDDPEKLTTVIA